MNTKRDQQRDTRGQVEFLKRKMNEIDQGVVRVMALVNERFEGLERNLLALQGSTRNGKKAKGIPRRRLRGRTFKMPCKPGVIRGKKQVLTA